MEENGDSMGGKSLGAACGLVEHSSENHIPEGLYIARTLDWTQREVSVSPECYPLTPGANKRLPLWTSHVRDPHPTQWNPKCKRQQGSVNSTGHDYHRQIQLEQHRSLRAGRPNYQLQTNFRNFLNTPCTPRGCHGTCVQHTADLDLLSSPSLYYHSVDPSKIL
jgi:hypothetical protein